MRAFNETQKTGSELLTEVRKQGYDVSGAMLRKTANEIDGYWDAKPKTKKEKIREVAEQVEYSSHGKLAEHINRNENFDVVRHYVSEALRESQSSTQQVYVAISQTGASIDETYCSRGEQDAVESVRERIEKESHEYEQIGRHTWTVEGHYSFKTLQGEEEKPPEWVEFSDVSEHLEDDSIRQNWLNVSSIELDRWSASPSKNSHEPLAQRMVIDNSYRETVLNEAFGSF